MEFSGRCHSTTGGITSSTLLPFGLWAPGNTHVQTCMLLREQLFVTNMPSTCRSPLGKDEAAMGTIQFTFAVGCW